MKIIIRIAMKHAIAIISTLLMKRQSTALMVNGVILEKWSKMKWKDEDKNVRKIAISNAVRFERPNVGLRLFRKSDDGLQKYNSRAVFSKC